MDTHWEQINSIQMSLHTSESILNHTKNHKELQISCSLVNIARGKCNLSIYEESNKKRERGKKTNLDHRSIDQKKVFSPR